MTRMIALGLLLIAVPAFARDAVVPADRVTSFVNIRSAPSTDAMEVGRLNVGESARLIRSIPRWHEIQLADGTRGVRGEVVDHHLPDACSEAGRGAEDSFSQCRHRELRDCGVPGRWGSDDGRGLWGAVSGAEWDERGGGSVESSARMFWR
jgi:hypothetical protein